MKKLVLGLLGVIVMVVLVLLVLPFIIPVEKFKVPVLAQIEKSTGRKVRVSGPMKLTLFPNIALKLEDLGVGNPPWAGKDEMLTAKDIQVDVELMPLLDGTINMTGVTLVEPSIHLIQQGGQKNWVLDTPGDPTAPVEPSKDGSSETSVKQISLGNIEIKNGKLVFENRTDKTTQQVDDINLDLEASSLDKPMKLQASAVYQKRKIDVDGSIASATGALAGEPTDASFMIKTDGATVDWKGKASLGEAISATGPFSAKISDTSAWVEKPSPSLPRAIDVSGDLEARQSGNTTAVAISKGAYKADNHSATGDIGVKLGGSVPAITANLKTGALDLNQLAPASGKAAAPQGGGGGSTAGQPIVWSSEPIDMSGLNAVDADIMLVADSATYKNNVFKPVQIKAQIKHGTLNASLGRTSFYRGSLAASAVARATGAVSTNLSLENVQAEPLLSDYADHNRLAGTLNGKVDVSASGKSQKAMISTLNGSGQVRFSDGAIKGINLAAMFRNVKSAFNPRVNTAEQKTDFSELSASFTIQSGVVRNSDLRLMSPFLRVAGQGEVNLPTTMVNYRVIPELVNTSKGQGGKEEIGGIMVPVIVSGPMHNLQYTPDLQAIVTEGLKDPRKIENTVKGVKENLKNFNSPDDIKDALKGFLGGR